MLILIGRFLTIQNEFSLPESRKPLHILMCSWVSFLLLSLLPRDSNCGERHEEVLLLSLDVRVTPMIVIHPRVFFFVGVVVRSWSSSDWSQVVCTICSQLDGYKFTDNIQLLLNVRLRWCRFDSNFGRLGRLLNATWAATRLRSAKLQSVISHGNFLASTIQRWVCVSSKKGAVWIDLRPNLSTPQKDLFLKPSTRLVRTEASTDENATVLTCDLKLRLFRFVVWLNILSFSRAILISDSKSCDEDCWVYILWRRLITVSKSFDADFGLKHLRWCRFDSTFPIRRFNSKPFWSCCCDERLGFRKLHNTFLDLDWSTKIYNFSRLIQRRPAKCWSTLLRFGPQALPDWVIVSKIVVVNLSFPAGHRIVLTHRIVCSAVLFHFAFVMTGWIKYLIWWLKCAVFVAWSSARLELEPFDSGGFGPWSLWSCLSSCKRLKINFCVLRQWERTSISIR